MLITASETLSVKKSESYSKIICIEPQNQRLHKKKDPRNTSAQLYWLVGAGVRGSLPSRAEPAAARR